MSTLSDQRKAAEAAAKAPTKKVETKPTKKGTK